MKPWIAVVVLAGTLVAVVPPALAAGQESASPSRRDALRPKPPAKPEAAKPDAARAEAAKPQPPADAPAPPAVPPADAASKARGASSALSPRAPYVPQVKKTRSGKSVVVITNDDLEKVYGPPPEEEGAEAAGAPAGAAQEPAADKPLRAQGSYDPATAAARLKAIQGETARLDQLEKWVRNPYLRRPPMSDQEKEADRNLSPTQLIKKTQDERAKLQEEAKKLKEDSEPAEPAR